LRGNASSSFTRKILLIKSRYLLDLPAINHCKGRGVEIKAERY
jgi:hypothetical protein